MIVGIPRCSTLGDYEEAVRRAGGQPRVLDRLTERPAQAIAAVDGLLLAGGADVDPALYGAIPHPSFVPSESGRDDFECELVHRALEADLPVLAICRGIQLLNVARGGGLIQDIPDLVPGALDHSVTQPRVAVAHTISVHRGTLLDRLMRDRREAGDELPVNSRHHQAVDTVAEGLIVAATAPDGVIEAIEDPSRRFCLGVQWHPENFWRTGEFAALFTAFVRASTR